MLTSFVYKLSIKILMFIDRISEAGNAIPSVRPSVCFSVHLSIHLFPLCRTDWPLTLNFCMWVGYDRSSQGIEGQGHRSRSRSWVRLLRLVRPRSSAFFTRFFIFLEIKVLKCLTVLQWNRINDGHKEISLKISAQLLQCYICQECVSCSQRKDFT